MTACHNTERVKYAIKFGLHQENSKDYTEKYRTMINEASNQTIPGKGSGSYDKSSTPTAKSAPAVPSAKAPAQMICPKCSVGSD